MKRAISLILSFTLLITQLLFLIPAFRSGAEETANLVTTFNTMAYVASGAAHSLESVSVSDNKNFTSAIKLTVVDGNNYGNAPAIYKTGDSSLLADWLDNGDAEMRFWIKIPKNLSATLRLMHSSDYSKITKSIEFAGKENWQEIRIKKSEFSASSTFEQTAKSGGTINFQILTSSGALVENDAIVISHIQFYDAELSTPLDSTGGTVDNTPKVGTEIAKYDTIGYLNTSKPYVTAVETVGDNKNFGSAVSLKITNGATYSANGGDAAMYAETVADANIENWAKTAYAELRFWIKVPHAVTFTLRLQHYEATTGYNNATYKLSVLASDKWQEIRIARKDFSATAAFDTSLAAGGKVNLQILTDKNATDFMNEGETLYMSHVEFYNGYIEGEIDATGGTVDNTPKVGTEIAKYDTIGYLNTSKPYVTAVETVGDNKNFGSAVSLKITDGATYSANGGDAAMYAETVADANIENWAKTAYAELRFWIKVPHAVTFTLRLQHYEAMTGYNNATYKLSVPASDKWQEIRIKRSDFTAAASFAESLSAGGSVNLQILTDKNATDFLIEGEKLYMSPVEFYNGYIEGEIDADGGTIVITATKGDIIGTYNTVGWNATDKGYAVSDSAVSDNKNFTSAAMLQITDEKICSDRGVDAAMYSAKTADISIKDWANKPYAEMRFWVKVPHEVTFTLRLIHNLDLVYTKIAYTVTVMPSDKWQEIRIAREDFVGDVSFNDAILGGGTVNIQILTDKGNPDFLKQDEKIYMSPVEFYNGYIEGEIDATGGTIEITATKGELITKYTTSGWNSTDKGYTLSDIAVEDNKNFTIGRKLLITDEALYLSESRAPAVYKGDNSTENIADWAKMPYNEMRFWIKTQSKLTFTVRLMNNSGSEYAGISTEITVMPSDNWQEIRIAREDFTGSKEFNSVVAKNGNVHLQILTNNGTDTFLKQGEYLLISPIEFYNGYIDGEIDETGGTVKVPDIYGKKIDSIPAKVIKSIDGTKLQLISVYDNDFVSKALKFTVTDEAAFYKQITQVNTNGADKPLDLSAWNKYSKAEMRFWIKVPHGMKFKLQVVEHNGSNYPYIETELEIAYKEGWQEIVIPRSAFTNRNDFSGEYIQYIRLLPLSTESENYLKFCDSLYISQVEFFDGIIPDSANRVDKGKKGELVKKIELVPYVGNGTLPERIDVTDNSNFKSAVATKLGDVRVFSEGEGAHVIHNSTESDISKWYSNSNAELRFWVRSSKDLVLQIGLQNPGSDKPSSYRAIWAQIDIEGSDNWQEIRLSQKHFSTTANFDPSIVRYIKIKGTGDESITSNEIFYISDIEVYDGFIDTKSDNKGGTTKAYSENAIVATFSDYLDYKLLNGDIELKKSFVNTNKYFTDSIILTGNGSYNINLKTYYDAYDVSRGKNGSFRLWVKTDKENSFNIVLTDKYGKTLKLPFKAVSSAKWQELRVELSSLNLQGFDFTKLFSVSVEGKLNSLLQLGKSELWKKALDTSLEAGGGEIEPPKELPPSWDSLPTMSGTEENKMLVNTSNSDFWIGDWNDNTRERSIVAYNRGLDKKDVNYNKFTIYKEISVVNAEVYYKNPTPAMFYLRKVTDITPYIKTGTLRFWIKVPKNMTIRVTLQSIDENNKYSTTFVDIKVKKTDELNGFSEIQIPLKDFYFAAVEAGVKWNPYYVRNILIGGVDGCNKNTFLAEGELLCVSHFEIWKAEALEPEPFDPTRIFYSLHGDIFVKDIDDVLSKTTMLSAYKDKLNFEKYEKIVKRYFEKSELSKAYTIKLLSAGQYDYNVVKPYDDVSVYIPIPDSIDTDKLKIAIHNSAGIHETEFTVEDGYIVINTKQFGEFLFLNGGKRNTTPFDYNYDMSEFFGLVSFIGDAVSVKEGGFNWWIVIIPVAVVLVCAGITVTVLILRKKGIINRKGRI